MLEVCVDSAESARNAIEGGADRLELCSHLPAGGLTPSYGLLEVIFDILRRGEASIPVMVMLRPREGNFVYSKDEIQIMCADFRLLHMFALGEASHVVGFVIGVLKEDNTLDEEAMSTIISSMSSLPKPKFTLHRAFDLVPNWKDAVDIAHRLGITSILTSGQKQTAMEGKELLAEIVQYANEKGIAIIVGSGVSAENIIGLFTTTKASWYHASASVAYAENNTSAIQMGPSDTNVRKVTSKEKVTALKTALNELSEVK